MGAAAQQPPRSSYFVKQEVAKYAQTFLEYPPMQKGATFNLEALKAELEKKMEMLKSQQGS